MGICRDTFGKLSYTMTVPNGLYSKVYSVHRGENRIIVHEPYYRTNANIIVDGTFWYEIEPFDSFIKAVRFMKKHRDELL